MSPTASPKALLLGPLRPTYESVLTPEALGFVAELVSRFGARVEELLQARRDRQELFNRGERPDFLASTAGVRQGSWHIAPEPADLQDRRVEITGPVDRKMIINALNSGANVFMADFEDSNAPTWDNVVQGQLNLRDAVQRTIRLEVEGGKTYALNPTVATLFVRPRGWHLIEKHLEVDGRLAPAALFDFGLFFFHNARRLVEAGTGPYFYLPKMESHLEARLWNEVFITAEQTLDLPRGTIRATVLIETLPAAFEMDEILFELRDHSAGLNCGRWDYIFSFIKKLAADPHAVLPDRSQVTMEQPFLRAYTQLLIKTCHRRGAHAMGGMAAQIPIKNDLAANELALEKVRADKLREAKDGHDGTWVAHPGLVPVAKTIFDAEMKGPHQLARLREDVHVSAADLLQPPKGTRTDAGLRHNIRVGVQYVEAWLGGQGCVPLYNLMEDAATAEISRAQVWQWIRYGVVTDDGRVVDLGRFRATLAEELKRIRSEIDEARYGSGKFPAAAELFERLSTAPLFEDFLTIPAYQALTESEAQS